MALAAPQFMTNAEIRSLWGEETLLDRLEVYSGARIESVTNAALELLPQGEPVHGYLAAITTFANLHPRCVLLHDKARRKQAALLTRLTSLEHLAYDIAIWVLTFFGQLPKVKTTSLPSVSCMNIGNHNMSIVPCTVIEKGQLVQHLRLQLPNERSYISIILNKIRGDLHVSECRSSQGTSRITPAQIVQVLAEILLLDPGLTGSLTVTPKVFRSRPMSGLGLERPGNSVYSMTKEQARTRWSGTITANRLIREDIVESPIYVPLPEGSII